uniref:Uncharacterized protein n=1 Tax=Anguilla anguilla TaxID=7936 RepID=A0A0E9SP36_ANGAN
MFEDNAISRDKRNNIAKATSESLLGCIHRVLFREIAHTLIFFNQMRRICSHSTV